MDFVQGLPKYEGYNAIPMVMDRLTKAAHFIAIRHLYTAPGIARIFLDNVVRHHGLPKTIVTNWDTIFLSIFQKELFKLYGVQLNLSIAYHPQSEGQTEHIDKCLEMYLGCTIHAFPKSLEGLALIGRTVVQLFLSLFFGLHTIHGSVWIRTKSECYAYFKHKYPKQQSRTSSLLKKNSYKH
jgi:hypothetical protein